MTEHRDAVRVTSPTEGRNPRTLEIDTLPTLEVLRLLNGEDALVAPAVREALPQLAVAVDAAVERYRAGGTVHYFGAGTSGRLATLDVSELPPTFSAEADRTVAHHAGGTYALQHSVEGIEDDLEAGRQEAAVVTAADVAVGVAASGRTPWVVGALTAARDAGAYTVMITSAPEGPATDLVDAYVHVATGPEAIAGSTRLKAGTAQKLVLNGFSTALMVRLGKTYSNLMVDVAPSNAKLRGRVVVILEEATGATEDECVRALDDADGDTKTAIVLLLAGTDATTARAALEATDCRVREALAALEVPMEE